MRKLRRIKASTGVCPEPGCANLVGPTTRCPVHGRDPNAHWSRNRDRAAQASFRKLVLARDGYRCRRCGTTGRLEAAHVLPISRGGGYEMSNGVTLCHSCHVATERA